MTPLLPSTGAFLTSQRATRGLETLSLSDVRSHLIQQLEKGDSVFEAFGLKVPLNQLTFWGTVVVLSVQLYFFLHLREFHAKIKPHDTGWDTPWIGIYPSKLSRAVYGCTILLPVIAIGLLALSATVGRVQGFEETTRVVIAGEVALVVLATAISALLSWLTWKHSPTVVRHGEAKPAAATESNAE